jgi:hypothetical protein
MHRKNTGDYFLPRVGVIGTPCAREHLRFRGGGVVGGGLEALKQAIPPPPLIPKLFPSIVFGL